MNEHVAPQIQAALNNFLAPAGKPRPALPAYHEAVAMYDDSAEEWFVRLYHHNNSDSGPECCGMCGANGEQEAEFIALCINTAMTHNEHCKRAAARMFDWSRMEGLEP
jgi:hypothetical protein